MKKRLSKLTGNEKGQGLVIVLALLAIGGLVITPLLAHMYTGLSSGQIYWERVPLSYAADAGLEHGIWKVDNYEELLELDPLNPADYDKEHTYALEEINDRAVEVDIKLIWPLAGLEGDVHDMTPADGLRITGGIVNALGRYEARMSYDYPEVDLLIDRVAVWLPPGFEYVADSSAVITTHADIPVNPTEVDWNGGTALIWDFLAPVNFLELPDLDQEDPLGGFQPAVQYPTIKILRFNVTPEEEVAIGSYSWVRTNDGSLSWESGITIYQINSTATDNTTGKSITASAYTYVSEGVDTGWIDTGGSIMSGDYRAIGNTLMQDLDQDQKREIHLPESSATISDIPADSEVFKAYLYWSGWRRQMQEDRTCIFKIAPETETMRPDASGNYTECTPYGDFPNYLCVDEEETDEDSTYVQMGTEAEILRPGASGDYTECDPYGDSPNYQCVDEAVADENATYVETGEAEILRPNAAGTYSQCDSVGASSNYQCVDEEEADEGSTYVRTWYGTTELDTYNITDHVIGTGTINSVTVYIRTLATSSGHAVETVIRTHDTNYFGTYTSAPTSYTDMSTTYTTNPYTGSAWTWDEIDALEIGVKHYDLNGGYLRTTQVYAGVNYGPTSEEEIDAYNIDDHSQGNGTINSVTVHVRSRGTLSGDTHAAETVIRTHDTNYFGTYTLLPTSYTGLSTIYTTNPYTGSAWTWSEIDALQAGVRHHDLGDGSVRTTQVYVAVDYGPTEGIDTYNIDDHSQGSGTIHSVTVHVRCRGTLSEDTNAAETIIRTHGTSYNGTYTLLPTSYTELSTTYTTNPYTGLAWAWDEIDALEAGVRQYDLGDGSVKTTQVYVVVTYGPFYEAEITADTWWLVENDPSNYAYSCFKDVTDLVTPVSFDGNATYTVGDVDGDTLDLHSYAAWSLIIIYSSPYEQGHQFFLWDQLLYADGPTSGNFTIEGFQAPEDAEATLTCFVGEGDYWYQGDSLQFNGDYMSDEINPQDDVWNGKSSGLAGEPIDGVDIDTFDVSSPIINPGDTSAEVAFVTGTDCWNLVYLILAFRSDLAVLTPSSAGILCYGLGGG